VGAWVAAGNEQAGGDIREAVKHAGSEATVGRRWQLRLDNHALRLRHGRATTIALSIVSTTACLELTSILACSTWHHAADAAVAWLRQSKVGADLLASVQLEGATEAVESSALTKVSVGLVVGLLDTWAEEGESAHVAVREAVTKASAPGLHVVLHDDHIRLNVLRGLSVLGCHDV